MNNARIGAHTLLPACLFALLLSACGGGGGNALPAATLNSISVTSATLRVSGGRTQQLYATGRYSGSSTQDLTSSVTWAVNPANPAINLTAGGLVSVGTCAPPCTATVTATSGSVVGTATVTIRPDAFTIAQAGDPLAGEQWHLRNTGQTAFSDVAGITGNDVNTQPVYSGGSCSGGGCTGYGVTVAVVDTGLEIAHEDLAANVVHDGSWNFKKNTADPTRNSSSGDHGTSVSGIIASQAYNNLGGMGVAPEASLKGFNLIVSSQTTSNFVASLGGSTSNPNSSDVAIFNESWGYTRTSPWTESSSIINQYISGVSTLRGGLGALYVKAAGNGFSDLGTGATCGAGAFGFTITCNCTAADTLGISCENANFDNDNTLPYNIVAGALNASGIKSSYSTTGSALWVSAPGGEFGGNAAAIGGGYPAVLYRPAMVTTDQSTCSKGYSRTSSGISTFDNGGAPNTSCNYTNAMNGTSSATPVTSGVIALMLEANPNLTWRDVKHILASTPTIRPAKAAVTTTLNAVSYTAEQGWVTNAAGYLFHNWYGFGVVNASAAVTMATGACAGGCGLGTFTAYPGTSSWTSTTINAAIPDNSTTGASDTINIASGAPTFIEAVKIQVTMQHSYWGDLAIELTSPSGTRSILKNIRDGFTYNTSSTPGSMELTTNAFYGEDGNAGAGWTIQVIDGNNGTSPSTNSAGGTLNNWGIRIYGH